MRSLSAKKIVYKKKWEFISAITFGWVFTIACIWVGYIWGAIFFGACAIISTYPIFDSQKEILFYGTSKYKLHIDEKIANSKAEIGIFSYNDLGFVVTFKSGTTYDLKWDEIQTILAYKIDMYTFDTICLEVYFDEVQGFRITEETEGWYQYLEKIYEVFPQIRRSWEFEIAIPAFKENLTILFDRTGKMLNQTKPDDNSDSIEGKIDI